MGWSIGYDAKWERDIGYGVPAYCDHPDCTETIDRGLAYVCGGEPCGGETGCGLFFCPEHLSAVGALCARCRTLDKYKQAADPFTPKPEHPRWMAHVLDDPSWAKWRAENPATAARYRAALADMGAPAAVPNGRTETHQ